jgi:hypothetical protein
MGPNPGEQHGTLATCVGSAEKIEATLALLAGKQMAKEWYGTEEVARILGKAEFTVREWCRLGRMRAEKRMSGRGAFPAWVISHAELLRYQREGLLPLRREGVA